MTEESGVPCRDAAEPTAEPTKTAPRESRLRRLVTLAIAAAALVFVVTMVPVRDRCVDPDAGAGGARVAMTREGDGCVLYGKAGAKTLSAEACAKLSCEPGMVTTLKGARLSWVAGLLVLYLFGTFVWSARWHALLRLAGARITLRKTWRITLEAQAGGVLLPGGVGGDVLRVSSIVGLGGSLPTVIGSVLLDRAIGLASLATLAVGLALVSDPRGASLAVAVFAAIPFGLALGVALLRLPQIQNAEVLRSRRLAGTVKPIIDYIGHSHAPRAIAQAVLLSFVVSAVQLGVVRGLCAALGGLPKSEVWIYTGSAITFVLSALPTVPGGWGTSDAAFVLFFGRAGIAASTAFAVALLHRLNWYLSAAIGAVLYGIRRGNRA